MKIEIKTDGVWYHGSNLVFTELKEGSTITQWRELAEAFSHKPTQLEYDDEGRISVSIRQPQWMKTQNF